MYLCLIRHQTKMLYGKSGEKHIFLTTVWDICKLLHVQALYPTKSPWCCFGNVCRLQNKVSIQFLMCMPLPSQGQQQQGAGMNTDMCCEQNTIHPHVRMFISRHFNIF
jgi:hypothetical protein